MTIHPLRFGVLTKGARNAHDWAELARETERLGFSTLLISDHARPQFAPFPALVAAGAVTERLRLGTLVLNNDFRHPTLVAREAATADLLTNGRIELGVGAGWADWDWDEPGLRRDRGATRAARFAESVALMRRLMDTEEEVSAIGEWYRLSAYRSGPRTAQSRLPILVGAGGPAMLRTAARVADIVSFARDVSSASTPEGARSDAAGSSLDRKVAALRESAGTRFAELELNILVTDLEVGPAGERRGVAAAERMGLTARDAPDVPQILAGTVPAVVRRLLERRERWGLTYIVVNEEAARTMAPVVAELAGR